MRNSSKNKGSNYPSNKPSNIIYGVNPVNIFLQAPASNKKRRILKIFATEQALKKLSEDNQNLINSPEYSSKLEIQNNVELSHLFPNTVHQGIALKLEGGFIYHTASDLKTLEKPATIVILDKIQDPQNFGNIIRSSLAFGVDFIVIGENESVQVNETVAKTSAGYSEIAKIIKVKNITEFIKQIKQDPYRFWVAGLDSDEASGKCFNLDKIKEYSGENLALVFGSEGAGISDLVKKNCDLLVRIDMQNNVESLNMASTFAIAAWYRSLKS